jgi:8-oxo-dGTP pyrophosphatase MutT (NUDIX family)
MMTEIETRLRARLAEPFDPDLIDGDFTLNPGTQEWLVRPGLRDAAVLVPIVVHEAGASMILTRRSATLRKHTGQVAFPGGAIDPEDAGPVDAALREAEEEIGLPRALPEPLGVMPDYITGSGYRIRPVVALVPPGIAMTPNPDEVEEAFEVPFAHLMDPANHVRSSREWMGGERFYYEMPFHGHHIWGVTAGIIRAFYERVYR